MPYFMHTYVPSCLRGQVAAFPDAMIVRELSIVWTPNDATAAVEQRFSPSKAVWQRVKVISCRRHPTLIESLIYSVLHTVILLLYYRPPFTTPWLSPWVSSQRTDMEHPSLGRFKGALLDSCF